MLNFQIKEAFRPGIPLTIHWDGKILPNLEGKKQDRLPILVTGLGVSKLLAVPSLQNGTATVEASAIVAAIKDWGVEDNVSAMCFDTTSVNSGNHNCTRYN